MGRSALVALAGVLTSAGPALAAQDDVGAGVDPSGVTITIVRWQGTDHVRATGSAGGNDPTGCDWAVVPAPVGALPPVGFPSWRPDSYLGLLTCDGVGVQVIWVGPHNIVDLEAEARRVVEEYVAHVPVPRISVRTNPSPAALVGVESWLWVQGYDGAPITGRIDALGVGVDVRIEPTPVTWRFGDGTTLTSGLGRPYPERSDVRHGYRRHGIRTVTAQLDLVPRYRIDGTDWVDLPAIRLADALAYRIREARAVIVRPD